ncbi:MAG: hypothetical protein A2Y33_06715 [Spirochaetes bacterium GWF1_51_8]|nr:MAG: hypothetical protein A2Y33_06715 [Spirochaetes bacterium GWF1_51_8]
MEIEKIKSALNIAAIVMLVLAGLTLLPSPGASKQCILGYKAKCSFTPFSTGIMLLLSGALFFIRSRVGQ